MEENESITKCPERSFSEKLNTWVQTSGIIIGSIIVFIWGIYSFIYKEIIVPKSAPVNVTLNLSLKKSGIGGIKESKLNKSLIAIEMRVTAKNPSSRTIYLLPSAFIVWGFNVGISSEDYKDFLNIISSEPIPSQYYSYSALHSKKLKSLVVAIGNLLTDEALRPGESVGNCFTFYVPQGEYDSLQANIAIPCAKEKSGIKLEWKYNKETDSLDRKIFFTPKPFLGIFSRDVKEYELKEGAESLNILKQVDFSQYGAMSIVSLWEEPKIDDSKAITTRAD